MTTRRAFLAAAFGAAIARAVPKYFPLVLRNNVTMEQWVASAERVLVVTKISFSSKAILHKWILDIHFSSQSENLPLMKSLGFCLPQNQNLLREALGLPVSDLWPHSTDWIMPR